MAYKRTPEQLLQTLRKEQITTWFDLGLFIDRIKENRKVPAREFTGSFNDFKENISGNVAFLTFHYMVDGVTIEVGKYAEIFKRNHPDSKIHYISGIFKPESYKLIPDYVKKYELPEIQGFDDWKLYKDFYFTKLERGSKEYNQLILDFWKEVLFITEKLSAYIFNEGIDLLFLLNICSNPGNVSYSLALVLISELMGIAVINNNHDFYWDGGSAKGLISPNQKDKGPRDFFFTNSHLGEFFSIIELLFPWESRFWINVNINKSQTEHLIRKNGINPSNVMEIGTAVDTSIYKNIDKRRKINAFIQFEKILSRYNDKLIVYSVEDAIGNKLVDEANPKPILIGNKTKLLKKFASENIIFLQPTRIISRKRIEVGFSLLQKIIEEKDFKERLVNTKNLKLTILITGPIAPGHYKYYEKLLLKFKSLISELPEELKRKVFLAMLFSELDKEAFKKRFTDPVGIPELYNIASLILLPSKTEGRGLPIIEATSCGTPIFCRRYLPENVYAEVIGEDLEEQDRLKVIEYDGKYISRESVRDIMERVLFPHKFTDEILHNRRAVLKRYSLHALKQNMEEIIYQLYLQLKSNRKALKLAKKSFEIFHSSLNLEDENFRDILKTKNRQYLPGYGKLGYMIYLKSLIDPSYFRIEEQEFRGRAFHFAREILIKDSDRDLIPGEKKILFFNAVENLFLYRKGEIEIRHDHSFTYRHRNKNYYHYQDLTIQELSGLINILYFEIISPSIMHNVSETPHFFTDWNLALLQLTASNYLGIDNRKQLIRKLKKNIPIAYFPGEYLMHELEFFALQAIRSRLNLAIEEELTEDILMEHKDRLEKVYLFTQEKNLGRQFNLEETKHYISHGSNEELKILFKHDILKLVPTDQWTVGIHFGQLGKQALGILKEIRDRKGFLISNRRNSVSMTDFVDMDCFHIGKVRARLVSEMLGIPLHSGYIQFVPAGIRTCLAYPTPIQSSKDFDRALGSVQFKNLCKKLGKNKVFEELKKDAETKSSPIKFVLNKLENEQEREKKSVEFDYISGIYQDGNPFNGVISVIHRGTTEGKWDFSVVSSSDKPKLVTQFIKEFEQSHSTKAKIGWNGGYILNPELVGKLGLPESYIGSPLGLIISGSKILCPPLFNKAALLIHKDGSFRIERVNCKEGLSVKLGGKTFIGKGDSYNPEDYTGDFCYYDLLFSKEKIPGNGRVLVRLAGNEVKEIIRTKPDESIPAIPVGLCLSFSREVFPANIQKGDKIDFEIEKFSGIIHAVEAGPMLIRNGEISIDMELEGWKTNNSIRTQAARLDYTDMRGPKIAAGTDEKGNLYVLAINGRIRESVGASHINMAEIFKERGIQMAMGFDPGGSSTLVVEGIVRNISPYNKDYEKNVFSLPPQPRAVSNAIIGYIKKN